MKIELKKFISFDTREDRKNFIYNNEGSIYEGKTYDDEKVIVILEQGKDMDVKIQKQSKPNWWEVIEYDAEGWQVGVTYEPYE